MQNNYIFSKDTLQYSGIDGKNKITPGRRQSKTQILSRNVDQKSLETEFFDCHLLPQWRQMAIKNTVSIDS